MTPLLSPSTARGRSARRWASRRAVRGAALVEAAFMLPMFVLLYYASLYAHNLSVTYIKMSQVSRANAWTFAMGNCNDGAGDDVSEVFPASGAGGSGSGGATEVSPMPDNPNTGSTGSMPSLIMPLFGDIASIFPNPNGSTSTNATKLSWRLPNLYNGSGEYGSNTTTVTRSVTVDCNNVAKDGGAANAVIYIGKSILSFL